MKTGLTGLIGGVIAWEYAAKQLGTPSLGDIFSSSDLETILSAGKTMIDTLSEYRFGHSPDTEAALYRALGYAGGLGIIFGTGRILYKLPGEIYKKVRNK